MLKSTLSGLQCDLLRLSKIVAERVERVGKFTVNNRGRDGTSCFRIKVKMDTSIISLDLVVMFLILEWF